MVYEMEFRIKIKTEMIKFDTSDIIGAIEHRFGSKRILLIEVERL